MSTPIVDTWSFSKGHSLHRHTKCVYGHSCSCTQVDKPRKHQFIQSIWHHTSAWNPFYWFCWLIFCSQKLALYLSMAIHWSNWLTCQPRWNWKKCSTELNVHGMSHDSYQWSIMQFELAIVINLNRTCSWHTELRLR